MAINLQKPLGTDVYNVEVFNNNANIIENNLNDIIPKVESLLLEIQKKYPYFTEEISNIDIPLDDGIYYNIKGYQNSILISIGKSVNSTVQTLITNNFSIKQRVVPFTGNGDWTNLTASVVDNLTTVSSSQALSARQGNILENKKLDRIEETNILNIDTISSSGVHICKNGISSSKMLPTESKAVIIAQYGDGKTAPTVQTCYDTTRTALYIRYYNTSWSEWNIIGSGEGGGTGNIILDTEADYPH